MPADDQHPDDYSMSFGDHLEELRKRILWAILVPLPVSVVVFMFSDPLIEWLYRPLDGVLAAFDLPRRLQVLGPAEALVIKIKLSLIFAVVFAGPWILWQAWLFVRPGLYRHERRFVYLLVPGSAVLTVAGGSLMYYVMLPLMLRMLVLFGATLQLGHAAVDDDARIADALEGVESVPLRLSTPPAPRAGDVWLQWPQLELYVAVEAAPAEPEAGPGQAGVPGAGVEVVQVPSRSGSIVTQEFRLTTYINFVLLLLLGIVIAFQMPLVILLLGWLGLVSPAALRAKRKYALFTCAVVAAVTTPADVLSMIIMLVPLVALYELSIVLLVLAPAKEVAEGTLWTRFRPRPRGRGDRTGPGSGA